MASKLLNLVALSALAVLAVTFGPASTNALSTGHVHMNRHIDHAPIAKRKRDLVGEEDAADMAGDEGKGSGRRRRRRRLGSVGLDRTTGASL